VLPSAKLASHYREFGPELGMATTRGGYHK
jgi:hypothetical protein